MFDLEQAISDWRRQMLAAEIKTPVPLEELESHLREDVEHRIREGLKAEQAFEIAVGKFGQAFTLKQEFGKISTVDKVRLRKRAGFAFALIFGFYSVAITRVLLKNHLTLNERLLGFAAVVAMLSSVYVVWQILPRFLPVIANKTIQSAIGIIGGISGIAWLMAFVYFILPRCHFTQGQLLVAFLWAIVPVIVLPTTGFILIDKSERQLTT